MTWGVRIVLIVLLTGLSVGATGAFDLEVVGNITYKLPETDEYASSIVQDADGNLAVAGISRGPATGESAALVLRIDDHETVSELLFGGSGYGAAYDGILADNGDMVVAGVCGRPSGEYDVTTDAWVASIDSRGTEGMNASYGEPDANETARCIVQTSDGGFVVAGYSEDAAGGGFDALVAKIDAAGAEEWRRTFGGEPDDMAYAAVEDENGDILVAGSTGSFGRGAADGWVVRMTPSGQEIWNRTYGGIKDDAAFDLIRTPDGSFVFTGITTYLTGTDRTDTDAWMVKFNASGATLLDETYGGADVNASAKSIVQAPDGGYLIAGDIEVYGSGNRDAWFVRIDAEGNRVREERFGSLYDDAASGLIALPGGGYALCGNFETETGGGDRTADAWVVVLRPAAPEPDATAVIETSPTDEPDDRPGGERSDAERDGEGSHPGEGSSGDDEEKDDDPGDDPGDEKDDDGGDDDWDEKDDDDKDEKDDDGGDDDKDEKDDDKDEKDDDGRDDESEEDDEWDEDDGPER